MTSELRFHSYVTFATVFVMYFAILHVVPLLSPPAGVATYVRPVSTLLMSLGVYTSLAKVLLITSRRLRFVKNHLLGPSYVNGTWVGSFQADLSNFYTVEHFEQTLSSLKIRGQARAADGTSYAYWHSSSETILEREGRLEYTYELHRNDQVFSSEGHCKFYFERVDEASPPWTMHGYSVDLLEKQPVRARIENNERRISEDLIPFDEAFKRVKEKAVSGSSAAERHVSATPTGR